MRLYTIDTGNFMLDGGAMFGVVPKSIWNKLNPANADNLCNWAMRSLLIEDGDRLVLVDNGLGDKQDEKFFSHYHLNGDATLESSLAKHGFHRKDVTDVILTHLHFDHCGGSVIRQGDKLSTAFPNATYWSNERHWKWATEPNPREKASFLRENIIPIQESGQLRFVPVVENGISTLTENIAIRFAHGHTDAMMLPQVRLGDRTLVFMADLLPALAHLPLPYVMAYDMFPLTTMQEKKAFLEEAVDNDYLLFFQHDLVHECCTLKRTEKGVRHAEVFNLEDWR